MSEEGSTSRDQISGASLSPHDAVDGVVRSSSSSVPADSRSSNLVAVKVYDDDDASPQETVAPCASAAKRRLFVGNLDPALTEADVLTGFKRFGTVSEVSLFKDATTQVSTGHACVVFATADAALAAMGQLDGGSDMAAAGAELWVDWAIGQGDLLCIKEQEEERARRLRTLFFAKVPSAATVEEVTELFSKYGAVSDLNLFRAWAGAKNSKGCGLVEMAARDGAAAALAGLHNVYTWPGMDEPMVLEWMSQAKQRSAGSGREPKAKEMCKVLLSNLPKGLNKAELLHTLSQLGEVVEVHITGEAPGQVADGTAFARFLSKETATSVVAALQAQPVHFRHPTTGAKHVLVASRALTGRSKGAAARQAEATASAGGSMGGSLNRGAHRQHHSSSSSSVRAVYPTYRVPAMMGWPLSSGPPDTSASVYPSGGAYHATPPQFAWPLHPQEQQAAGAYMQVNTRQRAQQLQRGSGAVPPVHASQRHVPMWHMIRAPQQGGLQAPFMSQAGPPVGRWPPVDVCEALVAEEEAMGHLDVPVHVQHVLAQQVYASLPEVAYPYYGPSVPGQGPSTGPEAGPQLVRLPLDSSNVSAAGGVLGRGYGEPGVAQRQRQVGGVPMSSSSSGSYGVAQAWPQQPQQGVAAGYPVLQSGPVLAYSAASNTSGSGSFYQLSQQQQQPLPQGVEARAYQAAAPTGGIGGSGLGYQAGVALAQPVQPVQVLAAQPGPPFATSSGPNTITDGGSRYLTTGMTGSIAGGAPGAAAGVPYGLGPSGAMARPPSAPAPAAGVAGASTGGVPMALRMVGQGAGASAVAGALWGATPGGTGAAASGTQAALGVGTAFVPVTGEQAYAVAEQLMGMGASTGTTMMLVTAPDGSLQVALTGTPEQRRAAHVLLGMVVQENQGQHMGVGTL